MPATRTECARHGGSGHKLTHAEWKALVEPTEKILCLKITTLSCRDPWLSVNNPAETGAADHLPHPVLRPGAPGRRGRGPLNRGLRQPELQRPEERPVHLL